MVTRVLLNDGFEGGQATAAGSIAVTLAGALAVQAVRRWLIVRTPRSRERGALRGRCGGDDLWEPPFDWAPEEGSRMRRWHPDCSLHCDGSVVADPPRVAPPQWPPGSQPPADWGAGGGTGSPLLAGLNRLREGLEILRGASGAVAQCDLPAGAGDGFPADSPRPMLEWLLELPAQWAAAQFPPDFGYFRTWVMRREDFVKNGCGQFHRCDVICDDGSHPQRTGPWKPRSCCAVEDALRVLYRILLKAEMGASESIESKAAQRLRDAGNWDMYPSIFPVPDAPFAALRGLRPHDAVEGYLSTFLYTYNITGPDGGVRELQYFRTMNWAMRECAGAAPGGQLLERVLSIFKPLIWRLDRFISSMPREGGVLFRGVAGVRMARWYRLGKHVASPSFLSLSKESEVAWHFAGTNEGIGTWCAVQAVAAFDVKWASLLAEEEDELLLGSNTVLTVMNKPTEDERQVLGLAHDAVSLAQVTDAAGGELRPLSPEDTISYRVRGLAAHSGIFKEFKARYVEPRVRLSFLHPAGAAGALAGATGAQAAELSLTQAFAEFMGSDSQWLLVLAPGGWGKSSALLSLYADQLLQLEEEQRRREPPGKVPVFISLPLIDPQVLTGSQDWLRHQLCKQFHLGAEEATGRSWELLEERGLIVFADSADEAIADTDAMRARLQQCSLAARAGLPGRSKGIVSVREEDMDRLELSKESIAGQGCAVLSVLPFGDNERRRYCEMLGKQAAEEANKRIEALGSPSGEALAEALRGLPGCQPQAEAEMMRQATMSKKQLQEQYAAAAAELTLRHAATFCPGEQSALLFTMGAEAAQHLKRGADSGAVIEAGLRRRMRRGAARVSPEAWPPHVRSEEDKVDALMRVAEALADELTYSDQWVGQIGAVAEGAAFQYEGSCAAEILQLLPGLPLRTSDAEDTDARFAFPHRRVQEWLAAEWAVRAAARGPEWQGAAQTIVMHLRHWAGAGDTAAQAAERILDLQQDWLEGRGKIWSRVRIVSQHQDWAERAKGFGALADENEERFGPDDGQTAMILIRQGEILGRLRRFDEAVEALRRALAIATLERYARDPMIALGARKQLGAVLCDSAPPGCSSDQRSEGEEMLRQAREGIEKIRPSDHALDFCDMQLAKSLGARGQLKEAEELYRRCIERCKRAGATYHSMTVVSLLAENLEQQATPSCWEEAVELRRRKLAFDRSDRQGARYVPEAARAYANALRHAGRPAEAEEVLREHGLLDQRETKGSDDCAAGPPS